MSDNNEVEKKTQEAAEAAEAAQKAAEEAEAKIKEAEAAKKAAEKEAKDAEKAAKKAAEEEAAAAAATAAVAAKAAEDQAKKAEAEAKKAQAQAARAEKKAAKQREKRDRIQALKDQCPPEYKPVSTSKYFWCGLLSFIPGLGVILTILFSFIPRNRNFKSFERAILVYYIIGLILCLIALIVLFAIMPANPDIAAGITEVISAFGF